MSRPLPLLPGPRQSPSYPSYGKPLPSLPIEQDTRRQRPVNHRPSCTHIIMDKLYGTDETCHQCGQPSNCGWLYACQQDSNERFRILDNVTIRRKVKETRGWRASNELETLGFSKSIIDAAAAGQYTKRQLQFLKQQKKAVAETIQAALQQNEELKAKKGASATILDERLAAAVEGKHRDEPDERKQTLFVNDGLVRQKSKRLNISKAIQSCEYLSCHRCRPAHRDRTFVAFESVFENEIALPTAWDPEYMPVANAEVLKNMDYICDYSSGYSISDDEEEDYDSDIKEERSDSITTPDSGIARSERDGWSSPTSSSRQFGSGRKTPDSVVSAQSDNAFRQSWQKDLQDKLGRHEMVPRESTTSFNVQLWRNLSNEELAKAAAIALPGKDSDPDLKNTTNRMLAVQPDRRLYALTEEAAETGSPDIIAGV